jgi:hypothetical protein
LSQKTITSKLHRIGSNFFLLDSEMSEELRARKSRNCPGQREKVTREKPQNRGFGKAVFRLFRLYPFDPRFSHRFSRIPPIFKCRTQKKNFPYRKIFGSR